MENAKWKDSIKSVSHVVKHASLLLPKSKDECGPTMTIILVLLWSPLLNFGNPSTIVMSHKPDLHGTRP
jgi:hypothetical protein